MFNKILDKILDKVFSSTAEIYNRSFVVQDFHCAEGLKKAILNLNNNDEEYRIKKIYFEAIFLDQTDRAVFHPQIRFLRKKMKKNPLGAKIDELLGFGEDEILFELPLDGFDVENYFESNWFHPSVEIYKKEAEELNAAKINYDLGTTNFFNYFEKRLEVYDVCKPPDHIKYYNGIDREKYIKELRKIFNIIL